MTDYEKLRELAEKATPGPWYTDDRLGDPERNLVASSGEYIASDFEDYRGVIHRTEDADYIAAVHPDVILNLLEDLRQTRAERDAEKKKRVQQSKDHAAEVLKWDEHANRLRNIIKENK